MSTNRGLCLIGCADDPVLIRDQMDVYDALQPATRKAVQQLPFRICTICLYDRSRLTDYEHEITLEVREKLALESMVQEWRSER